MLNAKHIQEIEKSFPGGLSSRQILELLRQHGVPLTEATLRKYVQLGLLPRSRRVGEKGKHRGSHGIYPVEVIRRIDEVRRAMSNGATLESLARQTRAVRARLATARASLGEALDAAELDLGERGLSRGAHASLKSELAQLSRQAKAWLRSMEAWAEGVEHAAQAGGGALEARPAGGGRAGRATAMRVKPAGRGRRPGGV